MHSRYLHFDVRRSGNVVTWTGAVHPSDMSPEYRVRVRYALDDQPEIQVLSPALRDREGEPIPHVYPANILCTYLPRTEWTPAHLIADTIVPWISDWLWFYEVWHGTGEWLADGEHPAAKNFPRNSEQAKRRKVTTS